MWLPCWIAYSHRLGRSQTPNRLPHRAQSRDWFSIPHRALSGLVVIPAGQAIKLFRNIEEGSIVRCSLKFGLALMIGAVATGFATADRPNQKRENADYVVVGKVGAVYVRNTEGYREYIIELSVEAVEKGEGLKKGDTLRAFCYQRKEGKGGLEFDSAGHSAVPKEGQRIKAFVNRDRGRHEGVYPNWFDPTPAAPR